ncbi:hypothetical protein [Enterococcus faecium]|uniref:hypothetical protein n=1 Tax=Enterococcus faecium TaxID=1352 RepID=UPI00211A6648|nr:hypothetical protein [Enterococcus faecium]
MFYTINIIGKVRAIILTLSIIQLNQGNLVTGGDALAEEFLTIPMETDGNHAKDLLNQFV